MADSALTASKAPYERKGMSNVYDLSLYTLIQQGNSLEAACFKTRFHPHPNADAIVADRCYQESFRRYRFFRQLSQELQDHR